MSSIEFPEREARSQVRLVTGVKTGDSEPEFINVGFLG
jgi:hypothetical protein